MQILDAVADAALLDEGGGVGQVPERAQLPVLDGVTQHLHHMGTRTDVQVDHLQKYRKGRHASDGSPKLKQRRIICFNMAALEDSS